MKPHLKIFLDEVCNLVRMYDYATSSILAWVFLEKKSLGLNWCFLFDTLSER